MTGQASDWGKTTTGLDPKLAAALSYVIGWATGLLFLTLEKDSRFVRFHAMQSTITFGGVTVVYLLLAGMPIVGWLMAIPFLIAVFALWLVLMFKALKGEQYKLPYIGELAEKQLK